MSLVWCVCLILSYPSAVQLQYPDGVGDSEYEFHLLGPNRTIEDVLSDLEHPTSSIRRRQFEYIQTYDIGPECQVAQFKELPPVDVFGEIDTSKLKSVKKKQTMMVQGLQTPCDHGCYEQKTGLTNWGLTRISQHERPDFSADDSYKMCGTGEGVTVYVVDTGVNIHHRTFSGRARVGYTVKDLRNIEGDEDKHGHGTHVAGLIAGISIILTAST